MVNMKKLKCPNCELSLNKFENSYKCAKGHCFDVAKQGYLNLYLNKGLVHGDDKLMVNARNNFLNEGYYLKFRDQLTKVLKKYSSNESYILDSGCGEGYYTNHFSHGLDVVGLDLSKNAIIKACKNSDNVDYIVGSCYYLPFEDQTFEVVVSIFSPLADSEYLRVLKSEGKLIVGVPLADHLWELKELIYDNPYKNDDTRIEIPGFKEIDYFEVKDKILIKNNQLINDLFSMTPYYYKTSLKDKEKLVGVKELEVNIQFGIVVYQKL